MIGVVVIAFAAFAPLLLSVMARSAISIAVSVVLLFAAGWALTGPTVIHQILSAVLYLAALVSASVLYAGKGIEWHLQKLASGIAKTGSAPLPPGPH